MKEALAQTHTGRVVFFPLQPTLAPSLNFGQQLPLPPVLTDTEVKGI